MASEHRVAVLGAGRMGRGIALSLSYAGHPVVVVDLKPREAAAPRGLEAEMRAEIERDLTFLSDVGVLEDGGVEAVQASIRFADAAGAADAVADATIVFECVPETIEAKRPCYEWVSRHASADCIVASTTSTIDAQTLAALVTRPERFLNAHWLNPAHLIPLVELSPSVATSSDTIHRMKQFLSACGKVPIVCASSPGYIVPRIQALAMNEAARLVEEGVASAEDVDMAVRVGFGLRFAVLGLLEFIDWGGCDILYHASFFLSAKVDAARFAAPKLISDHMEQGRRGLRDGAGFYEYEGVDLGEYRRKRMHDFIHLLQARQLMPVRGGNTRPDHQ
ncbi:3-hydroxybutyryl-CoA dehydrogenase [Gluconacetobacter asukensis]|uniref:L-gulonate 3-dehydrogenase n=1 Tax=Gluconacetobacter asukensis TaxID=1017181 RepID=A0A7W4J0B2_9PROT|nr:3-hydroxybutyryl-CoA dehydrogenase [Gluconacetobacter asukensis]MBB2172368.1 3-hydroxybutyryl-CoA dehydrogenase [Gluconacetobacter asukensis]